MLINSLLNFSLSLFFCLSAVFSLLVALQHGRDLKCHTEWLPPHVWKLEWRETGAGLSSPFFLILCLHFWEELRS